MIREKDSVRSMTESFVSGGRVLKTVREQFY
jgi:hypothetical protein